MQNNPWAQKYGIAPQAGPMTGPPPAPTDPYKVQQDQINNSQEAERLRLSQESAARDRAKFQREEQKLAATGGIEATGDEKTAAFLTTRLADGVRALGQHKGSRPTFGVEAVRAIGGDTAANYLTGDDRQIVEANQLDVLDSALTLGTGAAYTKEQLEGYRKSYFPVLGDSEPVIAEKARKLKVLLQAARLKAGSAAPMIDTALAEAGLADQDSEAQASLLNPAPGRAATPEDNSPLGPGEKFAYDETGNPIGILDAQGNWVSGYSRITDNASEREAEQALKDQGGMDYATGGEAGLYRGISLGLSDEIAGLGAGVHSLLTGGEFTDAYEKERDIERAAQKISREQAGFLPELAGGVLAPAGVLGQAKNVRQFAQQGAVIGGVAGAGEGRGLRDSATNALLGSGVGALAGAGTGKIAGALSGRGAPSAKQAQRNALLQDFQQEEVRALPANVGGTVTNRMTSGMAQSPIGSAPIRAAAREQGETFGTAIESAAARSGRTMPADEAGEAFRQSARAGIERDGQRIGRIYDAAKKEASGVKIKPNQGIRQIDEEIAKLSETAEINQPLINELNKLKSSLQQNTAMSIDGLKTARSFAGKEASNVELRATPAKATMARVFDALATDFEGGLRAAGKGKAATLFKRADGLWKARIDDIDGAWEPIIGSGKSGEDIVKSIETMAAGGKGGFARLKTVLSGASPTERGDMVATLIDRMGHARKGAQNAEGDVFSPNVFLTNWNGMSKKAKALMFGNTELRQSLDRLSRISESVKDSAGFANTSNTGGAIAAQSLIGAGGYSVGNLPGLALTAGATYLTGKLLASPRFAAWLARAPRQASPQQTKAYVDRLRTVAAAEPALSGEISRFAQFLNAANDVSPGRAVAQGQQEDN